ncbi:hypothetical protein SAMN05421810_106207 [Amycolatopsis arida]|uniref:Uncharacterized protein n=1 Tax=Amycolatopsis arida TaxID=587909 RepID=A0A1I5XQW8_9PSEU|nr:hypothetical protein [Amycolatopsis arida]SFQ34333.1 hypothetical protein SAMN05421810_106207 [Amycolatopsis arida]
MRVEELELRRNWVHGWAVPAARRRRWRNLTGTASMWAQPGTGSGGKLSVP